MTTDTLLAISAGATFLLALAAFWAIWNSREQEKRDRKERILNEIVKWLRELENRVFNSSSNKMSKEMLEEIDLFSKSGVPPQTWHIIRATDQSVAQLNSLNREIKEGEYNQKVASKLDKGLSSLVEIILVHLKKRRQLILDSSQYPPTIRDITLEDGKLLTDLIEDDTRPLEGLTLSEQARTTIRLGRNAGVIKKSIVNAVDKAIEIKMSFLQS